MILGVMGGQLAMPTDPYYSNVVALLRFNGASDSTNFIDAKGHTFSVAGGSPVISTAHSKFGGASMCCNNGYIASGIETDFGLGNGDYTVEGFVRSPSMAIPNTLWNIFDTRAADREGIGIAIGTQYGGLCVLNNTQGIIVPGSWADGVPVDTWFHIAVCREGTTLRAFVDGVLKGSATDSRTLASTAHYVFGANFVGTEYGSAAQYVDMWRVTKGVARYTANFTPPSYQF